MTAYEPEPGDIGLTQISGDVGLAIRFGQWLNGTGFADYEHAFVYVGQIDIGSDQTDPMIVEAEPGGALISPLSRYDAGRVAWLHCPDDCRDAVTAAALGYRGVPYSFLDYAALAAHRFHLPVPGLKGYIESTGHMMCSQLGDTSAADGGWHLFADERWPGYVTPGDLYRLYGEQEAPA